MYDPSLIFTLRELSSETIAAGVEKWAKSKAEVLDWRTDGVFDSYRILSGPKRYDVLRMGWFVRCSCKDFEFKGGCCKHIVPCLPQVCRTCLEARVATIGDECNKCEIDNAPYLKPTSDHKPTSIGNFRI